MAWSDVRCTATLLAAGLSCGAAAADDWKTEANARIEALRKGDAELLVVDGAGRGLPGVVVAADQAKHGFAFGTAVNTNLVSNASYRQFFLAHFEWAVLENESKWFVNERRKGYVNYAEADSIITICRNNGKKVRGHNVFWAKEEYTPPWARSDPDEEFRRDVDNRLDSAVPHFAGRFVHWDVNNEMLDGDYFRRRLGDAIEPYMFSRTQALDPAALLFVNDYSTVECCPSRTEAYLAEVQSLIARGGPVQAIGVQGHYWGATVDPVATLAGLDRLATLGLPLWITEYDCVNSDENARADALENLYRAAFSHPAVDGILMWGFWAGSHWRGADAAIVNLDWTLNAAGTRYLALLDEWTTHAAGATAGDGRFAFRGFHGRYEVTVDGGNPPGRTVDVVKGAALTRAVLPLDPSACAVPGEVQALAFADGATLTWRAPTEPMGLVAEYDVLRSGDAADFSAAACVVTDSAGFAAGDPEQPAAGAAYFYLARAANRCPSGEGPLGARSDGTPRAGCRCP